MRKAKIRSIISPEGRKPEGLGPSTGIGPSDGVGVGINLAHTRRLSNCTSGDASSTLGPDVIGGLDTSEKNNGDVDQLLFQNFDEQQRAGRRNSLTTTRRGPNIVRYREAPAIPVDAPWFKRKVHQLEWEADHAPKTLVKNGVWCVPVSDRPAEWQTRYAGVREPDSNK